MEKISLSDREITNLKSIFNENYLMIKKVKDIEQGICDDKTRLILKEIRNIHEKNLFTIMKLLDGKERFI